MTVYELIQELVQYGADTEIRFNVKGNLDFDVEAEFDRYKDDVQDITVNVDLDDRFEFSRIKDWTKSDPKYIEIVLDY